MKSDFFRFEFGMIAIAILNKTVSDFLLLAWSLIQGLGSSSFLTEAVLYFGRADSIASGIHTTHCVLFGIVYSLKVLIKAITYSEKKVSGNFVSGAHNPGFSRSSVQILSLQEIFHWIWQLTLRYVNSMLSVGITVFSN
jgi:hypothetical protein